MARLTQFETKMSDLAFSEKSVDKNKISVSIPDTIFL